MLFWLKTMIYYVLAAITAFLCSILLSFLSVLPFGSAGDDSPVLGILWFFLLIGEGSLLVPLSLGITAEAVQKTADGRRFKWSRALLRFACAIPIAAGPVYLAIVLMFREDARPHFWIYKEIFAWMVTVAFAYLALRIRRRGATLVAIAAS
jgi:hypothetical protein